MALCDQWRYSGDGGWTDVRDRLPALVPGSRDAPGAAGIRVLRRAWVYRLRFAGHGFCETLCLADVNPEAVEACRLTVARNGLSKRVAVYRSENLDGIPRSECWDLVVGNPPRHVRFTPESGHRNRHAYYLRRTSSGSLAIFAAIPLYATELRLS